MKKITLLLLTLVGLWACNQDKLYSENKTISNLKWEKGNTLTFETNLDFKETQSAKLGIAIRHSSSIVYNNLPLMLTVQNPQGKSVTLNLNINLRDEKTRVLQGEALGDICDLYFLTDYPLNPQEKGRYIFTLQPNHPQKSTLVDLISLGIFVKKI